MKNLLLTCTIALLSTQLLAGLCPSVDEGVYACHGSSIGDSGSIMKVSTKRTNDNRQSLIINDELRATDGVDGVYCLDNAFVDELNLGVYGEATLKIKQLDEESLLIDYNHHGNLKDTLVKCVKIK